MKTYQEMTLAERQAEYAALCRTHQEQKALGLDLNMARGKPGREQLDMVMEMYNIPLTADDFITDGIDARNYGYVAGIPIARRLFADLLGCKPGQVIAGGNSSLEMMFDAVSKAYTHGLLHSEKPWGKLDRVKWICPVPAFQGHGILRHGAAVRPHDGNRSRHGPGGAADPGPGGPGYVERAQILQPHGHHLFP